MYHMLYQPSILRPSDCYWLMQHLIQILPCIILYITYVLSLVYYRAYVALAIYGVPAFWIICFQKVLNYLAFQSFDYERIRCNLFQKLDLLTYMYINM